MGYFTIDNGPWAGRGGTLNNKRWWIRFTYAPARIDEDEVCFPMISCHVLQYN